MVNKDFYWEIGELKKELKTMKGLLDEIKSNVKPDKELWDNSDMISNWHISSRTLADWRANGVIGFVQVGHKIWYPREARDCFIANYMVKMKKKKGENE